MSVHKYMCFGCGNGIISPFSAISNKMHCFNQAMDEIGNSSKQNSPFFNSFYSEVVRGSRNDVCAIGNRNCLKANIFLLLI